MCLDILQTFSQNKKMSNQFLSSRQTKTPSKMKNTKFPCIMSNTTLIGYFFLPSLMQCRLQIMYNISRIVHYMTVFEIVLTFFAIAGPIPYWGFLLDTNNQFYTHI
ncbi:hypothetical protein AMTRI_Chr01g137490 [Amborella trichopoda]